MVVVVVVVVLWRALRGKGDRKRKNRVWNIPKFCIFPKTPSLFFEKCDTFMQKIIKSH